MQKNAATVRLTRSLCRSAILIGTFFSWACGSGGEDGSLASGGSGSGSVANQSSGGGTSSGGGEAGGTGSMEGGGGLAGSGATSSGGTWSSGGQASGGGSSAGGSGFTGDDGPESPVDIDAMLPEIPEVDCATENPCQVDGECPGDTNPCEGSYDITSAAEFETIRDCTSISGNLDIHTLDLTSLQGLSLLTVGRDLNIYSNKSLPSLEGLESLVSVGGALRIGASGSYSDLDNPLIEDLKGLEGLRFTRSLYITGMTKLASLNGLQLTSLEQLTLYRCPTLSDLSAASSLTCLGFASLVLLDALTDLDDLSGLTEVGSIGLVSDPVLTDIETLARFSTVPGNVSLSDLPELESLEGLRNLTAVGGDMRLSELPLVTTLDSLKKLKGIAGDLTVATVPLTGSLAGLTGLEVIGGSLTFLASSADFTGLESLIAIGGDLEFDPSSIESFAGLEHLRTVGGLTLAPQFDLAALSSLEYAGTLEVRGDVDLTEFEKLESAGTLSLAAMTTLSPALPPLLESVGTLSLEATPIDSLEAFASVLVSSGLELRSNGGLMSLDGLQHDGQFGRNVILSGNTHLTGLGALKDLETIGGDLIVTATGLTNLAGLDGLTWVGTDLEIEVNPALVSLDGLGNLVEVQGGVSITGNASLLTLDGLTQLIYIAQHPRGGASPSLSVKDNPLLPACSVVAFHESLMGDRKVFLSASGNDDLATCP